MKKVVIFLVLALAVFFGFLHFSQAKFKSYYSGDAISYNDSLYVTSADTGSLEVWQLEGDALKSIAKIKPLEAAYGRFGNFYSSAFHLENGQLYVYAVTDFSLYKYRVVGSSLQFISSSRNSYWEWYNQVETIGNNIATISAKGVKIWDNNLQIINAYDFADKEVPYNLRGDSNLLWKVEGQTLSVYDRGTRKVIREIPLNFRVSPGAHQVYRDSNGNFYVVDDYYAKKFNSDGKLLANFKHLDYQGFDMAASGHNSSVYFSNGIGVVRLNSSNMKVEKWAFTNNLAGLQGWAMGMKVTSVKGKDLVTVFNNSNIIILNADLKKVASVSSTEEAKLYPLENLFLTLDKHEVIPGTEVELSGGGFMPQEKLQLTLDYLKMDMQADSRGRFKQVVRVPGLEAGTYDIKVSGLDSKLSYSISLQVK